MPRGADPSAEAANVKKSGFLYDFGLYPAVYSSSRKNLPPCW